VNIINDFFYIAWSSEPVCALDAYMSDDFLQALFEKNPNVFCDKATIVLTLSSSNMTQYLQIEETLRTLKYFSERLQRGDYGVLEISAIQCRLLSYLQLRGDMSLNKAIGQRIDKLRKASVIGYDTARKLISILTLIPEKIYAEEVIESIEAPKLEKDDYYSRNTHLIDGLVAVLKPAIEHPRLWERASAVPEKIRQQKFSIGVTGVMNAGKSTMLNALLGEEILGTAVVPETANLTVIKYAKEPRATVHFWNAQEWRQIEQGAEAMEQMQHFVEETKAHFGKSLNSYVTQEGRSEEITVEALPSYTSAADSDKRCNLVKSVTLYSNLEFVQEGVEIVDTPGLDDPVVQREEITKAYLAECDLLCHLMNVGQSATQKDVAFIIESLLYRNVAQLLVVITRIDMVSEEELAEVITYTKSSIKARLEALDQGGKFEALIARIVFIPIAGKMALLHRTGYASEALALGYDLSKSGILKVEAYLREVLFGEEAPKARLIMEAAGKELSAVIRSQEKAYREEEVLLGKSAEEIASVYQQYQEEAEKYQKDVERLYTEIAQGKEELHAYFTVLQKGVGDKFTALQVLLKRRIMDDVRYTLRKEKRKPAPERIETMITTGLQDGLIDLLRDYRYQFQKRMDELMERIGRAVDAFIAEDTAVEQESAKAFFARYFEKLLVPDSYAILIAQTKKSIAKVKKRDLHILDGDLEVYFSEALQGMEEKFLKRVSTVNSALLEVFEERYRVPLERASQERESHGKLLKNALASARGSSFDAQQRVKDIQQKLQVLSQAREHLAVERIV